MKTRDKILKSALKLFAKLGVNNTSTAQITDDVGIAAGTLFVHFKTKQALVDALYLEIKRNMLEAMNRVKIDNQEVKSTNIALANAIINYYLKNYDEFLFIEHVENSPILSDSAVEEGKKAFDVITAVMKQWQKNNDIKQVELELLQASLWSLIKVLIKYYKEKKIKVPVVAHLDLVWDSIKA